METASSLQTVSRSSHQRAVAQVSVRAQNLAWTLVHKRHMSPDDLILFCIEDKNTWGPLETYLKEAGIKPQPNSGNVSLLWGWSDKTFYDTLLTLLQADEVNAIRRIEIDSDTVKFLFFNQDGVDVRQVFPRIRETLGAQYV